MSAFFGMCQSRDFTFIPNIVTIIVNTAGIHRVDDAVTIRPANARLNIAYAVAINGPENPCPFFGKYSDSLNDTERGELAGMFLAAIPAGGDGRA